MRSHERVQLTNSGERVANFSSAEDFAIAVQDAHVVVGLSPIHSNKDHFATSRRLNHDEPRGNGSVLMVQCSRHDTPPAFSVNLTDRPGHPLSLELKARECKSAHRSAARRQHHSKTWSCPNPLGMQPCIGAWVRPCGFCSVTRRDSFHTYP